MCNLASGCYGIVAVFKGDLLAGACMIWAGAIFDFFDGFAARILKKFSMIGKELDSLADLITFCFLPASILFVLIEEQNADFSLPFLGFLLVIFGAVRLAKFNNDPRQTDVFYGLPVPASGIFVSAIPFINDNAMFIDVFMDFRTLIGISVLLSVMMVSNIKLISLKFQSFTVQANWHRYLLILISIVLIPFIKIIALPCIILAYVALSVILNIRK